MHNLLAGPDRAMLLLLRAGLYNDPSLLEGFPSLRPQDWERLYSQAKRQTVSGVVLQALGMLPDSLLPPYGLLLRWVARAHGIETSHARMGEALSSLLAAMGEAGLSPVLQKGHAVARFYPVPPLRVSGDIDLYFPECDRHRADAVAASMGAQVRQTSDGGSCYRLGGVDVEHHSSLIQLSSPFRRRALRRLLQQEGTVAATLGGSLSAPVPTPLAELLMVSVHIMRHCLGAGIGLRHFCDYAVAYAALMPSIGTERYTAACRSLGVLRWTDVLHAFINTFLAPPSGPLPVLGRGASDGAVRRLAAMVLEGGNFGLFRAASSRGARNGWARKASTFLSFLRHGGLSVRVAPSEALWTVMRLTRGQLHV